MKDEESTQPEREAFDDPAHVLSTHDDETQRAVTFRSCFLGLLLSAFGGALSEIYYFKPQTVSLSPLFITIVAYVLGLGMSAVVPRWGLFRHLNPCRFNKKETVFIVIMATAAGSTAGATEILAVQQLYYNIRPNPTASILFLVSSQLLGYGIAGLCREALLYPSKMVYPPVLPLASMLETLFHDSRNPSKQLRIFCIVFCCIFVWELFPQSIFPLLTGISVFCIANGSSLDFTQIFSGSNGNEKLGVLSVSLDWQYISSGVNPLVIPLKAQLSACIGYVIGIIVLAGVYYGNVWNAKNFPFWLSQSIFYQNGTLYNQSLILDSNQRVEANLIEEEGLPYYSSTFLVFLITTNLALTATFTHVLLWNRDILCSALSWMRPGEERISWSIAFGRFWHGRTATPTPIEVSNGEMNPHYQEMLKYPDAPDSWYALTLLVSAAIAFVVIYKIESSLPWWSFLLAIAVAMANILFVGTLYTMTGISVIFQPFMQMIAGLIHHGQPLPNMYFLMFSYSSVSQAQLLLRDLKIAQYTKLPPRASFLAQISGTLVGNILNFVMMNSILHNHRDVLLSVEGTSDWSGQNPQAFNSNAITWGGFTNQLFIAGKRYQWVTWAFLVGFFVPVPFWLMHKWKRTTNLRTDYVCTPILCSFVGWLAGGINSSVLSFFMISCISQWYLRTRHLHWFTKYNYIIAAALDGGAQTMVFVLSFAVQGASGESHLFPQWWGAKQSGNYDRCDSATG